MKRNYLKISATVLAAFLLLPGCNRENPISDGMKSESIPLWFECMDSPSTRLDIAGPDDTNPGVGTWTPGDKIAIYVAGTGADFYQIKPIESIGTVAGHEGDESHGSVMVSLAANQNRANYAIYPATAAVDSHATPEDHIWIKYPDTYDYSSLTVAQMETYSPTPMVAINNPVVGDDIPALNFYHVGGVLRVVIPDIPVTARKLRFTFPEGMKFTGNFEVMNGGTTSARLDPISGQTYGNVITVVLPLIEAGKADLTLNIPLPYGDYALDSGERSVNVRVVAEADGREFDYMEAVDVVNWRWVTRAQGKEAVYPSPTGLGMIAGSYFTRGYLMRPDNTSIAPTNMYLTGMDQMMPMNYSNKVFGKRMYFSWNELGKIMTGNSSFDGSTGFETGKITIDGIDYRCPSVYDWEAAINLSRPGSIVNGQATVKRYSFVTVDLTGSPYSSGTYQGLLIYPDGGVFECEHLTNFNNMNDNPLSYNEYRILCESPTGCLFLPCAGRVNTGGGWSDVGTFGRYWSSTWYSSTTAYLLRFYSGIVSPSNTENTVYFFPVRLIRESY